MLTISFDFSLSFWLADLLMRLRLKLEWASIQQKIQVGMWAHWRLWSACASAQSDQFSINLSKHWCKYKGAVWSGFKEFASMIKSSLKCTRVFASFSGRAKGLNILENIAYGKKKSLPSERGAGRKSIPSDHSLSSHSIPSDAKKGILSADFPYLPSHLWQILITFYKHIQCNPFIALSLGSIGIDWVISEFL